LRHGHRAGNARLRRRLHVISSAVAVALLAGCRATPPEPRTSVLVEIDASGTPAGWLALPRRPDSVKLAVIGDSGRGWKPQHDVARRMAAYREQFPFDVVLMAGDNIYEGPASPEDYRTKFEEPYAALLEDGVRFQAVLGNHDDPNQRHYPLFNMRGHRYYTFSPPAGLLATLVTDVQVFALDSTSLDGAQRSWLDAQLAASKARWKIVLLHHPLYTSGRYGMQARLVRWRLETSLVEHGVAAVFSGHEHIYQSSRLQRGILYFVTGGAGSLRPGDGSVSSSIARSYDRDYHFVLVEIADDAMYFQAITRDGVTIDAGVLRRQE
jgi:3',5'-cyclic AMP phosphodiesterase CpdA